MRPTSTRPGSGTRPRWLFCITRIHGGWIVRDCMLDRFAMESNHQLNRVFVYGTLCRGQRNEGWWPHAPQQVQSAFVAGRLFDLGPYPAMTPGTNWVRGELWTLTIEQMAATLAALDELEDYRQREDDLYKRVVIDCHVGSPSQPPTPAYTYHYVAKLPPEAETQPDADGFCLSLIHI